MKNTNISRRDFLKRIGFGAVVTMIGTIGSKMTSFAMVNDNLSASSSKNALENIDDEMFRKLTDLMNDKTFPVGSIIHTSVCATMNDVVSKYGGKEWIQHTGYFLRGAAENVTFNNAIADNGTDSVTPKGVFNGKSLAITHNASFTGTKVILSHSGGAVGDHKLTIAEMPSHTHVQNPHSHSGRYGYDKTHISNTAVSTTGSNHVQALIADSGYPHTVISSDATAKNQNTGGNVAHNHSFTQPDAHSYTPSGSVVVKDHNYTPEGSVAINEHSNIPLNKSVYIWERVR